MELVIRAWRQEALRKPGASYPVRPRLSLGLADLTHYVIYDREGRDLERQHRLDVAHWLDIWLGWQGREWDSHDGRARCGLCDHWRNQAARLSRLAPRGGLPRGKTALV